MFIRKKVINNKKTGKTYEYHQLIASVNTLKGPRSYVLLHLGTLDINDSERKILSKLVDFKVKKLGSTVRFSDKLEQLAEQIYAKYLASSNRNKPQKDNNLEISDSITFTKENIETNFHRSVGSELVGLHFWKVLKFDQILKSCFFNKKEIDIAKIAIIGRLLSPGSECHTARWFNKISSLSEFLHSLNTKANKDLLYRIGDKLYQNKDKIEYQIRKNLKSYHSLVDKVYLYDLTNTYFEGNKLDSRLCKRGKSKEKRNDCPLVTLALVVDQNGFPVFSKVFKGNQSEPKTLKIVIEELLNNREDFLSELIKPSIVMDRGIATKENIAYLTENDYSYFVVERRNSVRDYRDDFKNIENFENYKGSGKEQIYLKKLIEGNLAKVLVYSTGKGVKERSISDKMESRFLKEANNLLSANKKGYIKDNDKIMIRIGRLKEHYGTIADKYKFELVKDVNNRQIVKEINLNSTEKIPTKSELPGCYVIETDKKDLTAKEIWDFYIKLFEVELSFKALKTDLGTRPVYHKNDERVESHLFLSVIAYSLLKSILHTLSKKDYKKCWIYIKNILQTHMRSTVVLIDTNNYKHSIRQNSVPEVEATEIYKLLNIKIKKNQVINKIRV